MTTTVLYSTAELFFYGPDIPATLQHHPSANHIIAPIPKSSQSGHMKQHLRKLRFRILNRPKRPTIAHDRQTNREEQRLWVSKHSRCKLWMRFSQALYKHT
jgi:hypothetical protein